MTTIVGYRSRLDPEPVVVPRQEPVVWDDGSMPGPLGPHELDAYDRRGFLTYDSILDDHEVEMLSAEAARLASDDDLARTELVVREPDGPAVRSVFAIHQ